MRSQTLNLIPREAPRFCLQCQRELVPFPGDTKVRSNRLYCGRKCKERFTALRYYHKVKDTPRYKKQRKKYFPIWVEANRKKFNEQMREIMRNRIKMEDTLLQKKKEMDVEVTQSLGK